MPSQYRLTLALIAGVITAGLHLSILGGASFILLQYLTQLPLFFIGLGMGMTPVFISACVAITMTLFVDPLLALVFLVGYVGPTLLVIRQALLSRPTKEGTLEWYPSGRLLSEITIYVVAVMMVLGVWFAGQEGGLNAIIEAVLSQITAMVGSDNAAGASIFLSSYGFVVPGIMGVSWIVMTVINGSIAQHFLRKLGKNMRPSSCLHNIKLPSWVAYLLAVSLLVTVWGGGDIAFFGGMIMMVLLTPFFFQGIGVVHQWSSRTSFAGLILVGFYLLMVLLQWPILFVVGFGILDQWIDLRRQKVA